MGISVSAMINVTKVITQDGEISKRADRVLEAGMTILEAAYVSEVPVNIGFFKSGLQIKKRSVLNYIVESTARSSSRFSVGFNYPLALFYGTGTLKNKPDYGYTSGRVRAGNVAFGIGGIRPNKASVRAVKKSKKTFMEFITKNIKLK